MMSFMSVLQKTTLPAPIIAIFLGMGILLQDHWTAADWPHGTVPHMQMHLSHPRDIVKPLGPEARVR
jgi:hypothetical protein